MPNVLFCETLLNNVCDTSNKLRLSHRCKIIHIHYSIISFNVVNKRLSTVLVLTYFYPVLFCKKKLFAGNKKIFAGTNTREISEMTLFLVIYTKISNIS